MSMYKCSACDFESDYKSNVIKHINKTKKCSVSTLQVVKLDVEIRCEYCDKNFSDRNSKNRHSKICKLKPDDKRKIKELEKIIELSNKLGSTSTTTNNNITNNTQNNTINNYITISLTPYNDPNMKGMQQYLEAALRKTFMSVPNLIESVHFNKEYPENHNICITNRRTKDAKVFDGKKWKTVTKDFLLNEMVDTYERELTNYAEEKGKTKFIKEYEKAKKRGDGEKDLKEEVHNVIYDNSEMVNTKIKEVQKLVIEDDEDDEEEEEEEENVESGSEPPQVDEYAEFEKLMNDSEEDGEEDGEEE